MKVVRFNHHESKRKVWVLQHDLCGIELPAQKTRPIHFLTFIYGFAADPREVPQSKDGEMFRLCAALDAKLSAVTHFESEVSETFSRIERPETHGREIVPFDSSLAFVAVLEAYLNAIYSTLEIVKQIARIVDPATEKNVRGMAKKAWPFDIGQLLWLQSFYDLRTELCHFGSSLPTIQYDAIVVEISHNRPLRYKQGSREVIPVSELLRFAEGLFELLDEWALDRLSRIDQNRTVRQLVFTGDERKGHDRTIRELVDAHLDQGAAAILTGRTVIERTSS